MTSFAIVYNFLNRRTIWRHGELTYLLRIALNAIYPCLRLVVAYIIQLLKLR